MTPDRLQAAQFRSYPPGARRIAEANIALLRRLPVSFVPLLLREIILYDWKFPSERKEIDWQLAYLSRLSDERFAITVQGFARLRIPPELERLDWIASPAAFSEQLSAYLWSSGQIDSFSAAALQYVAEYTSDMPPESVPGARLVIVVIGKGVAENKYRLFRKLRPYGTCYDNVSHENGFKLISEAVAARVASQPAPYKHWYIDGGPVETGLSPGLNCVSYAALTPVRNALQNLMRRAIESGTGPEAISGMLSRVQPEEVGLSGSGEEAVMHRFQLSLFTEASGTQIYSTTFVQWAAREILRRAQPFTLLVRYAPRQIERPMSELLSETRHAPVPDPAGSLVDADMGAWYTWLNQQRLSGAKEASFLVWFEDHSEAMVISPPLRRSARSGARVDLADILGAIT